MKAYFYIALILLGFSLNACNPVKSKSTKNQPDRVFIGKENGYVCHQFFEPDASSWHCKCYYTNGNLESEYNQKNGELDGYTIQYYENGKIFVKKMYSNGKLNGIAQMYWPNGTLREEINFLQDVCHGNAVRYDSNGKEIAFATYHYGRKAYQEKTLAKNGKEYLEQQIIPYIALDSDTLHIETPKIMLFQ